MLLTLKAPRAYLPFSAFANRSLVCVSGIIPDSKRVLERRLNQSKSLILNDGLKLESGKRGA